MKESITDASKTLTDAVYRVSNLMSDKDALKWTLRECALDTHKNILLSVDSRPELALRGLEVMDGLCDIGHDDSYIINRNLEILRREYSRLRDAIRKYPDALTQPFEISLPSLDPQLSDVSNMSDRSDKRIVSIPDSGRGIGDRKAQILAILAEGGEKTVSEIAAHFNVSDKSIQRDLLVLLSQKRVLAQGEKRWRTYSIA